MSVQGPRAIAALCLRCLVVLAAVNTAAVALVGAAREGAFGGVYLVSLALLVAVLPVAVIGFPAGVLTAHLLRGTSREAVHVAVFALVGAVLSVALCAVSGVAQPFTGAGAVAAAEGAVGAGGARWWSGRARARALRTDVPSHGRGEECAQVPPAAPEATPRAQG